MEKKLIKIDKNGTKYYENTRCPRCHGTGYTSYWYQNGICFKCGGSGKFITITKEYTPEYQAKLNAKREAKAKKEQDNAIAELMAHKDEALAKLGFKNGKTYCVCGDTYAIKDELKEAGAKFSRELGWHFAEPVTAYPCVEVNESEVISDEFEWWYKKPNFKLVDNAAEIVKAKMPKKEITSEYVGEVNQKIEVTLKLNRVFSFDSQFGRTYINNFEDGDGNVFIWKTGSWCGNEGTTYNIKGTIKEHSEYKGTKQNVLTRCKIA